MNTLLQLSSAPDVPAFVMGLVSSDPPCGMCIVGCSDTADKMGCVMACAAGAAATAGPCAISDVTRLASGDARSLIVEMFMTKPLCAACLRRMAQIDTKQIMSVCAAVRPNALLE